MDTTKKIIIAGIDITQEAIDWSKRKNSAFPLHRQFKSALDKAQTVEDLQALKKFLFENEKDLQDIMPSVQESSGDNIKDMAGFIDDCIEEKESGHSIM